MELTILGSGTYQPQLNRHPSSYLVKVNKQNLIFDFGRGIMDQLLKLNLTYADIDVIFITHTHADHCEELGSFLHIAVAEPATKEYSKKILAVNNKCRTKDLTIYGPRGIKKTVQYLLKAFNIAHHKPEHKIEIKELKDGDLVKSKGWTVKSYRVVHTLNMNCFAYRIMSKNKVLAYSGDTGDCKGLRQACKNSDLAIIETSWPKEFKPWGHMSGDKVGQVAQETKVKKLVLTHIAPYSLKNFNLKKEVKKFYKGPVVIAKDLMKIKI